MPGVVPDRSLVLALMLDAEREDNVGSGRKGRTDGGREREGGKETCEISGVYLIESGK